MSFLLNWLNVHQLTLLMFRAIATSLFFFEDHSFLWLASPSYISKWLSFLSTNDNRMGVFRVIKWDIVTENAIFAAVCKLLYSY